MATASAQPQTSTLQLRRILAAPRTKVFRAWTDPEALKGWFGPPGYVTPSAEVDLRRGGKYRLAMRKLPDGEVFYLSGTFQEVRPPERLVYTWQSESNPEFGDTLVTVEFRDRGPETEIVLTHERFPTSEVRDEHNKGWNGCLDRLEQFVRS